MDAKAKVSAYMYVFIDEDGAEEIEFSTGQGCSGYANEFGAREYPLITLTDHEAAMADLENLRRMYCTLEGQYQVVTESKASLLTGLEALAGEWRTEKHRDDYRRAVHACADDLDARIRTLTNSAKASDHNTNEESK